MAIQVYIDHAVVSTFPGASLDTNVNVGPGLHELVVKAWDSNGANFLSLMTVTAGAGSPATKGVTVTSPSPNANINGPVQVTATASSPAGIAAIQIYDNNQLVYTTPSAQLNTALALGAGSHYLVVQAWDNAGGIYFGPVTINVGSTGGSADGGPQVAIPGNAVKQLDIDQMSGWQSCDACAGPNGQGVIDPYSMGQNVTSPSVDGKAATFWLGGNAPWGSALWWKQLGAIDGVAHHVYDLRFFVGDPKIAQALEFDVNQSVNGLKFIWGTECDTRTTAQWRVWDTANAHWMSTGVPCPVNGNAWNHLSWEIERVNNQTHFIAVTLNGVRRTVDKWYYARPNGDVRELNTAFQMDGNEHQDNFQVWLDKISLYSW